MAQVSAKRRTVTSDKDKELLLGCRLRVNYGVGGTNEHYRTHTAPLSGAHAKADWVRGWERCQFPLSFFVSSRTIYTSLSCTTIPLYSDTPILTMYSIFTLIPLIIMFLSLIDLAAYCKKMPVVEDTKLPHSGNVASADHLNVRISRAMSSLGRFRSKLWRRPILDVKLDFDRLHHMHDAQ